MSASLERWYPWAVAALVGICWCYMRPRFPNDEKEFLSAALSLGAILTGFITTAKAILAGMPSESVMRRLREGGFIAPLVTYLKEALYGCLAFSVLCLYGFFLLEKSPSLPAWFAACWMVLASFAGLSFYRVSSLLFRIIAAANPK